MTHATPPRFAGLVILLFFALPACRRTTHVTTGGDVARGEQVIDQKGCGACHRIPGVRRAGGVVGPPLDQFARRTFISGRLPNTAANLITWLRDPREVDPKTAMPNLDLDDQQARDVAAFLYSLD